MASAKNKLPTPSTKPGTAKKYNISQSLMKALYYFDRLEKDCGLKFKAQYIDKISFPPTDAMKLGIFFEYLCTGVIPRDRKSHLPNVREKPPKTGGVKVKFNKKPVYLTAPYERMYKQHLRFKKTMSKYKIKILEKNKTIQLGNIKAVIDILAKFNGKKIIIDIKTSGLINNKWDEMGWDKERLPEKDMIMIQAVFYKWLWKKIYNEDITFYFLVFSSTNEYDCKFFEIKVDPEKLEYKHFEEYILNADKRLKYLLANGFPSLPEVKRCNGCAIKSTCKDFTDIPILEDIYY